MCVRHILVTPLKHLVTRKFLGKLQLSTFPCSFQSWGHSNRAAGLSICFWQYVACICADEVLNIIVNFRGRAFFVFFRYFIRNWFPCVKLHPTREMSSSQMTPFLYCFIGVCMVSFCVGQTFPAGSTHTIVSTDTLTVPSKISNTFSFVVDFTKYSMGAQFSTYCHKVDVVTSGAGIYNMHFAALSGSLQEYSPIVEPIGIYALYTPTIASSGTEQCTHIQSATFVS